MRITRGGAGGRLRAVVAAAGLLLFLIGLHAWAVYNLIAAYDAAGEEAKEPSLGPTPPPLPIAVMPVDQPPPPPPPSHATR